MWEEVHPPDTEAKVLKNKQMYEQVKPHETNEECVSQ